MINLRKVGTMSISTQQIQTVLRTYNKQLRLSDLNRRDKNTHHQRLKEQIDLQQADRKQHHSKQQRHKNHRTQ